VIPADFVLQKEGESKVYRVGEEGISDFTPADIGPATLKEIHSIHQGSLYLLGETSIISNAGSLSSSLIAILKDLFKRQ
jgi:hypothetical protein